MDDALLTSVIERPSGAVIGEPFPRAIGGGVSRGMSAAAVGSTRDRALPLAAADDLRPQVVNRHRFRAHVLPWRGSVVGKVYTYTSLRDAVYTFRLGVSADRRILSLPVA